MQKNNLESAWNTSYEKGDNNLIFPSEEIVRCLYKNVFPHNDFNSVNKISVLDFGCGAGRNSQIFDNNYDVFGYDLSSVAISVARKRYPKCKFFSNKSELISNKYHIVLADSCLDSMPWEDAIISIAEIYSALYSNGFFVLSLLEKDSKQSSYNGSSDILIKDNFEKDTIQTYFDWVRAERLLLPLFNIMSAYKVSHEDSDGNLIFSRWFITCRAN